MADYSNIEQPYNELLYRSEQNTSNGSVQEATVKSDGAMADVWISNSIRSENWKPKSVGFYINGLTGYAEFTDVFIGGSILASSGTIGGFTINATSLSATSGGNTTILSSGPIAFTAGPTGVPTVTISQNGIINATGAVLDGTSTIGGRTGTTLATAIDSSGHFADNAISTATNTILGSFTFGASGALQIGTYSAGVTGDIRISPTGILGRDKNNATTFSINATTGVAVLNGLVVGTNVGLGTAQDSTGVTTIIGNTVTTGYVNALSVVAGSVACENLTGTTITGKIFKTAASGQRVELSNTLAVFYNSSNAEVVDLYADTTAYYIKGMQSNSSIYIEAGASGSISFLNNGSLSLVWDKSKTSFYPVADSSYDLGSPIKYWRHLYLTGTADVGDVTAQGAVNSASLDTGSITLNGVTRTSWPSGGTTTLSGLSIDTTKNWGGYGITNMGNITQGSSGTIYTNWVRVVGSAAQIGTTSARFAVAYIDRIGNSSNKVQVYCNALSACPLPISSSSLSKIKNTIHKKLSKGKGHYGDDLEYLDVDEAPPEMKNIFKDEKGVETEDIDIIKTVAFLYSCVKEITKEIENLKKK